MSKASCVASLLLLTLPNVNMSVPGQQVRRAASPAARQSNIKSRLTGVYRLDVGSSDKLYSVVSKASSNLPSEKQQRFFDDLTIRLAAPDQLAIEQRGSFINIASSRAPRISFEADGIDRAEQSTDGHVVRTRAALNGDQLTVSTSGGTDDRFTVIFEPIGNTRRLRVTRRIITAGLNQPVVIQSIYNKVSDTARWSIYGEPQPAPTDQTASVQTSRASTAPATFESDEANTLRAALDQWIAATNARDINGQMSFYAPQLAAFYLARNVSREFVRAEKTRVFARAAAIDVRAEAPEIVFVEDGRTAIMRFSKRYAIGSGAGSRQGEVVQELRWRKTIAGWKIISERDVRVLR